MSFTASQIAEIVQGDILGDYCVIASQSGISGHLTLRPQAGVGAKSGVMRDIPAGGSVLGIPVQPDKEMKRQLIAMKQLPQLLKRMRETDNELAELKSRLEGQNAGPD